MILSIYVILQRLSLQVGPKYFQIYLFHNFTYYVNGQTSIFSTSVSFLKSYISRFHTLINETKIPNIQIIYCDSHIYVHEYGYISFPPIRFRTRSLKGCITSVYICLAPSDYWDNVHMMGLKINLM